MVGREEGDVCDTGGGLRGVFDLGVEGWREGVVDVRCGVAGEEKPGGWWSGALGVGRRGAVEAKGFAFGAEGRIEGLREDELVRRGAADRECAGVDRCDKGVVRAAC